MEIELTPEQEAKIRQYYHQIGSHLLGPFERFELRFLTGTQEQVDVLVEIARLLAIGIRCWRKEQFDMGIPRNKEFNDEGIMFCRFENFFSGHLEGEEIEKDVEHYIFSRL